MPTTAEDERALSDLRRRLLQHRPPPLGPDEGGEAFQQHKLFAQAVHQAARLDERGLDSQTGGWIRYMTGYFPAPRNGEADAPRLYHPL
jgi:hypothetical protein